MKKVLYLGLNAPSEPNIIHYPVIRIEPRAFSEPDIQQCLCDQALFTHIIFTSKTAVRIYFRLTSTVPSHIITVGKKTAACVVEHGAHATFIAEDETAEGVVELLQFLDLQDAYILWPHSALSRDVLPNFFRSSNIRYRDCVLYDTFPHQPSTLPDFNTLSEIIFTSPSTVDVFSRIAPNIPSHIKLTAIGPITATALAERTSSLKT